MNNSENAKEDVKAGVLNRFLWTCAGVNKKILMQCPTDWAKYAGQGGLILFTALMAMLSGGYAFFMIFNNWITAIFFGVFWGLLIFNLDRFIVNTMYSDGKYTISWGELAAGTPRLIIAVFIGIVISVPLELKIFEDEINVKIAEIKKEKAEQYTLSDKQELEAIELKIEEERDKPLEDIIASSTELKNSELFKEALSVNDELRTKNTERARVRQLRKTKDPIRDSVEYKRLSSKINGISNEINSLSSRYNAIQSQIAAGDNEYRKAMESAIKKKDDEINRLSGLRDEVKSKIDNSEESYKAVLNDEFGGFKTRLSAYNAMKKEDITTMLVGLFVTLLFIIIEVCPTFFKMMVASGPYDCLLDAERHIKKVSSMKIISDTNDRVNTEIMISTGKNRNRIESEIKNNKDLLAQVSAVQEEILGKAIEEWRKEELKKVQENPSLYINATANRTTNYSEV